MVAQGVVVAQFVDPLVGLLQRAASDHVHPAGQLGEVEIGEVVGEVGGFARALGPLDKLTESWLEVEAKTEGMALQLLLLALLWALLRAQRRVLLLLLHQLAHIC